MSSAELRVLSTTVFKWLAAITSLFFAFCRFLPSGQSGGYNVVDDAYIQMLHFAFTERLQFGRDIVFTFGPWGFLYGGYHPATHWISVVAWVLLTIVFWWAAWRVVTHFFKNSVARWLWMMAVIALASISPFLTIDVRLTAWPLLLLLLHFSVEEPPFTLIQAVLVVSLALLGLIKHSIFIIAVVTVLIIAADNVFRQRRFPWIVLVFAGGIFFFWILAGQRLSGFGFFLRGAFEIVSGYTEAMMRWQPTDKEDVLRFWGVAILVCAMVGYVAWEQRRFFGAFSLLGFAFIVFVAFKHGYVRHDEHEIPATNLLLLAAVLWLPAAWRIVSQKNSWLLPAVPVPVILASLLAIVSLERYANGGLFSVFAQQLSATNLSALATLFHEHPWRSRLVRDHDLDRSRTGRPDLQVHGSADVYPLSQTAVLASGLTCRPRPVFQSYSAYTPKLAEMNAAHLRSERAPDHILFDVWSIDDRFAAQDDSLSWLELLTRYEMNGIAGRNILMDKSAAPGHYKLIPIGETVARFDEPIAIPSMMNGPIWVTIDVRRSVYGKAIAMIYRPPRVSLTVSTRSGRKYGGRLLPAEGRAGFMISPVVDNRQSFFALASTNWQHELADLEVTSARITADDGEGITSHFQSPPVQLHFYRLDFQRPKSPPLRSNAGGDTLNDGE